MDKNGESMEKEELIRNVCIAASAAIPVAGGSISVLLDKYLPNKLEERKQNILENIQADLSRIDMNILENKLDNEEFYTVFLKVLNKSISNHREEKLMSFRSILLNSIINDEMTFDEVSFYIRLVDELSVDQIKILNLFYRTYIINDDKYKDIMQKNSLNNIVRTIWKNIDEDYAMACTTELIRFQLLIGATESRKRSSIEGFTLSRFGERFVKFIFNPIYDDGLYDF